jgi:ribosomal protein S18 acetylase RimI-like enzyme
MKDFGPIEALLRDGGLMYAAGEKPCIDSYFDRIYFEDFLRKPEGHLCFVAEAGGEVVGAVLANYTQGYGQAFLDRVVVRADKRRMGIGHALNVRAMQECKNRGAGSVFTYINPGNAASRAMLAGEGFKIAKGPHFLDTATRMMNPIPA